MDDWWPRVPEQLKAVRGGRGQSEEEDLGELVGWRCRGDETDMEGQGWMRCLTESQRYHPHDNTGSQITHYHPHKMTSMMTSIMMTSFGPVHGGTS